MKVLAVVFGFVVLAAILAFSAPSGIETNRETLPVDAPGSVGKALRGIGMIALGLVAVALLIARGTRGGSDPDG